jgi:hypothetical protein
MLRVLLTNLLQIQPISPEIANKAFEYVDWNHILIENFLNNKS